MGSVVLQTAHGIYLKVGERRCSSSRAADGCTGLSFFEFSKLLLYFEVKYREMAGFTKYQLL